MRFLSLVISSIFFICINNSVFAHKILDGMMMCTVGEIVILNQDGSEVKVKRSFLDLRKNENIIFKYQLFNPFNNQIGNNYPLTVKFFYKGSELYNNESSNYNLFNTSFGEIEFNNQSMIIKDFTIDFAVYLKHYNDDKWGGIWNQTLTDRVGGFETRAMSLWCKHEIDKIDEITEFIQKEMINKNE